MSHLLQRIVDAFQHREYEVSRHVWENFVMQPDRPPPSAIVVSIAANAPRLTVDDPADARGARAEIVGLSGHARPVHSHIGYSRKPMKIITAWYTSIAIYDGIEVH